MMAVDATGGGQNLAVMTAAFVAPMISPGPRFLVVPRTALGAARRIGWCLAPGLCLGMVLWIAGPRSNMGC